MERVRIACMKSSVLKSETDLSSSWNANDYQKLRVQGVGEIINDCLISRIEDVEYEGRTLVGAYKQACERLGKDPYDFAKKALRLTETVQTRGSSAEDRKELLAFYSILLKCFNQVMGR